MSRSPKKNLAGEEGDRNAFKSRGEKDCCILALLFKIVPSGNWNISHHHTEQQGPNQTLVSTDFGND